MIITAVAALLGAVAVYILASHSRSEALAARALQLSVITLVHFLSITALYYSTYKFGLLSEEKLEECLSRGDSYSYLLFLPFFILIIVFPLTGLGVEVFNLFLIFSLIVRCILYWRLCLQHVNLEDISLKDFRLLLYTFSFIWLLDVDLFFLFKADRFFHFISLPFAFLIILAASSFYLNLLEHRKVTLYLVLFLLGSPALFLISFDNILFIKSVLIVFLFNIFLFHRHNPMLKIATFVIYLGLAPAAVKNMEIIFLGFFLCVLFLDDIYSFSLARRMQLITLAAVIVYIVGRITLMAGIDTKPLDIAAAHFIGWFIDSNFGLLAFFPIAIFFTAGISILWRRDRENAILISIFILFFILLQSAFYAPVTSIITPFSFIIPLCPLMLAIAGLGLKYLRNYLGAIILGLSVVLQGVYLLQIISDAYDISGRLAFSTPAQVWEYLLAPMNEAIRLYMPSFFAIPLSNWSANFIYLAIIVLAGLWIAYRSSDQGISGIDLDSFLIKNLDVVIAGTTFVLLLIIGGALLTGSPSEVLALPGNRAATITDEQLVLETSKGESVNSIRLASNMANSVELTQGTLVAKIKALTVDNREIIYPIRAGIETAEWAYQRPDVSRVIKHKMPTVFSSRIKEDTQLKVRFLANIYLATFDLPRAEKLDKVVIQGWGSGADLLIHRVEIVKEPLIELPRTWLSAQQQPLPIRLTASQPSVALRISELFGRLKTRYRRIHVVSYLVNSSDVKQNEVLASIKLRYLRGETSEYHLRAGKDTAEGNMEFIEKPDQIAHRRASLAYDLFRYPADYKQAGVNKYMATIPLRTDSTPTFLEISLQDDFSTGDSTKKALVLHSLHLGL